MKIGDLSTTEFGAEDADVALLPTGSTEQHGPHAPLRTDALIASEMAAEASSRTDAVCLPPVAVGVSEEHRAFDGTLHVSPSTFRDYVSDVLYSASSWFDKAVVVNGHGGNVAALGEVCARLYRDDVIFATEWTWWNSVSGELGHGGEMETSLVMHLRPELVGDTDVEGADSWGEYVEGAQVAYDTDEFAENGVVGDPSVATPEKGEEIFEEAVGNLVELADWLADLTKES